MNSFLEQKKVNLAFPREGTQLSPQENCSLEHGRFFFLVPLRSSKLLQGSRGLQSCSHVRTCQPRGPKTWDDFDGSLGGPWSKPHCRWVWMNLAAISPFDIDGPRFLRFNPWSHHSERGGRYEKTECQDAM